MLLKIQFLVFSTRQRFLVFSLNALVLLLSALSFPVVRNRNTPLIRTLFPNFHGRRSRGRDVWQALQLSPVIFWYMTGETPETLEVVGAKIYGEVTLPRHWPRTANGQETSLYFRCAQQSITRFYLASPILKASCSCIHILHF